MRKQRERATGLMGARKGSQSRADTRRAQWGQAVVAQRATGEQGLGREWERARETSVPSTREEREGGGWVSLGKPGGEERDRVEQLKMCVE